MTPLSPHDTRAERQVLAGLMREPELVFPCVWRVGLRAGHWYWHPHAVAWGRLLELYEVGEGGPWALYWRLLVSGDLAREWGDVAGYREWFARVWDADPTGAWCAPAAGRVVRVAARRRAIHAANELIRDAAWGDLAADDPRLALLPAG